MLPGIGIRQPKTARKPWWCLPKLSLMLMYVDERSLTPIASVDIPSRFLGIDQAPGKLMSRAVRLSTTARRLWDTAGDLASLLSSSA